MLTSSNLRKFAPLGLLLSGLAALAAIVLYILQGSLTLPVQISLAVIVLGLALYVLLDPQRVRTALGGRQVRYGSNALLLVIAFTGILVVVNFLVSQNSKTWDMTEDKTNSLNDQSVEVLESLETPVTAEAYYRASTPVESTRDLLQTYQNNSDGKFTFEVIDPDTDPIRAQEANVTRDATIVLRMDGRLEQVTFASEQEVTAALIRLANPGSRAVYFLTGHGEFPLEGSSESNYNLVKATLEDKNYTVTELNLLANPNIPADALAVIVAGPTKPVSQAEIDLLKAYMDSGGSLIYLSEPRPLTEFGDAEDPMAAYLLSDWGIRLDEDVIIDLSSNQQLVAVSQRFGSHAITEKMYSLALVMPGARTVRIEQAPENVTLNELVYASDLSWGETDYEGLQTGQVTQDEGADIFPATIAIAGSNSSAGSRVVVVGDADFANSQVFNQYGNGDFIMNSIDWAAEQEGLINFNARETTQRLLVLPQTQSIGLLLLGTVFLLPILVIVMGVSVWLQRRRAG